MSLKNVVRAWLNRLGIEVTSYSNIEHLIDKAGRNDKASRDLELLRVLPAEHAGRLLGLLGASHAQLRQDLFVLSQTGFKRDGYFVEFGATDGVTLNNTVLLETEFGWAGILAEPARIWHDALRGSRSAVIDTRCVWKTSGETIAFRETPIAALSTVDSYRSDDDFRDQRRGGRIYDVETVSLNDLLSDAGAPEVIDYLSIDTEGTELEILSAVNFDRYRFRVITCEHNYTAAREAIHALLASHGYTRVLKTVSDCDDWYVPQ